jgi:hypothetical protein
MGSMRRFRTAYHFIGALVIGLLAVYGALPVRASGGAIPSLGPLTSADARQPGN